MSLFRHENISITRTFPHATCTTSSFTVGIISSTTWKSYFKNRNLVALSASPLLVYPTHFTGQEGYISDTEESTIHDKVGSDDDEMDMTLIRNDPLRIKERFVMPSIYNESVYKIEEEYKLYKTEL